MSCRLVPPGIGVRFCSRTPLPRPSTPPLSCPSPGRAKKGSKTKWQGRARKRAASSRPSPTPRAKVCEGRDVAVKKRDPVTPFVQPGEVSSRLHQPHQELPRLLPYPLHLHGHLEEVHLHAIPGHPHQRDA